MPPGRLDYLSQHMLSNLCSYTVFIIKFRVCIELFLSLFPGSEKDGYVILMSMLALCYY